MLSGRDIICISSIDWDFIWQGHQQIMTSLVAQNNRVLFIENTGVRSPGFADISRLRSRVSNWRRGTRGFREERENLFVYSPMLLPFPYSRVGTWINRVVLMRAIRRWIRATGFGRPIVWTFLPTPLARGLIRDLEPELTIYYCIDDLASSSRKARRISRSEAEVFREMDLVFVTSEKLRQRAAGFRRQVHLFPFGVSFDDFARARARPDQVPAELRDLPHPIVGYVGGLHQWVDQDLLTGLAAELPHVSFVFVGPFQEDVSRLAQCPNVHLLGARPHADLPRYIKEFDVGVIPYRLSEYTANVYPTKLNEYLAMGKPVVATDLPEIRRVNADHGDLVAIADNPQGFAGAVRAAIDNDTEPERARRIEVARENSWESRVARMSDLIVEALAAREVHDRRGWQRTLQGLYRTARERIAATGAVVASVYLLLFYTPLVWILAEPLRVVDSPRRGDAIVVFAGGVGESGKAGGGYQDRVRQAVDLYRAGFAPRMIFSSGFVFAFREAEIMKALAVAEGVPASAILLETRAANTHDNVVNVGAMLDAGGWRRVLLVSSPYHMRRALLVWRRLAPGMEIVATPPEQSQFYLHSGGASVAQIGGIAQEYAAIVVYWLKGWI